MPVIARVLLAASALLGPGGGDYSENGKVERKKLKLIGVTGALVALVGCTAHVEPSSLPEARALGRALPSVQAETQPTEVTEPTVRAEDPTGVVALRDALALALMNSPSLAAFSWEVRAREATVLQAGLFPNPEVTVELENFGGSGDASSFDASENTVWLSQLIELGGKRARRRALAEFEREVAGWDYEAARIDTFTEVAIAFVEVLSAQERKALSEELVTVSERALKVVSDQVKAGAVSTVEKSRSQVALASSRVELARRTRELEAARKRLAATWGSTTVAFSEAAGALGEKITPPPSEEALLQQVDENPDLARWAAELSARRALVALEDSRRIPNVTIAGGPRWFNETNDSALVFALNVPLPLFDRNQGRALEARQRLAKGTEERRAAEVDVRTALSTAYQSLAATHDAVLTLRRQVLPQAQAAFDGVTSAYRRGVFRYLDVLDAQRTLFALRNDYLDSLAAYHAAVARVERLVGQSLEEIRDEDRRS